MIQRENVQPSKILLLHKDTTALGVNESEWRAALTAAQPDQAVGIRHAPLSGDGQRRLHVASIPLRVGCHYHSVGDEQYSVVQGRGVMHFGRVEKSEQHVLQNTTERGAVQQWYQLEVQAGDSFTIPEGYAHQLCSTGTEELVIVFACPDSHLDERDRTILEDAPAVRR
jgi:mannose-6-phosphate isomerase-like protein (cupin superfamily)